MQRRWRKDACAGVCVLPIFFGMHMEAHMKRIMVLIATAATALTGVAAVGGALALGTAGPAAAAACPRVNGTTLSCGSYTISGLGSRKQQVLGAGASVLDLAVAMLETDTMQTSDYSYGDGKTGDSANFGIFKQNWYMLRTSCSYFSGDRKSVV